MESSILLFVIGFLGVNPSNCITLDRFSTKTTYTWAYNDTVNTPVQIDAATSFSRGNGICEAVTVYIVARHGTRYPSDGTIEDMPGLFDKIRMYKDSTKFTGFDSWSSRYYIKNESVLVQEGIDEHIGLGQRFARRFAKLFDMHGSYVTFVSSEKTRASNSSKYFYQGMANEIGSLPAYMNEINNTLARFYDNCYNYENGVEDNDTHMIEFAKYGNTSDFGMVSQAVRDRLGLNTTLTADDIYLIYEMCAYELYMFGEDLWCGLLTDTEREILEYGQDLEKYYESGYTAPIIPEMTCPLVRDILNTMKSSMNETWDYMSNMTDFSNTKYMAGKFVFGHSETMVPLFTALGLFNDSMRLLASNRASMSNRMFRTSHIVPYSANIAIAMYACNDTSNGQTGQSFVVKVWVNEMPMTLPACDNTVCSFMDFVNYYSPITENCDLSNICGSENKDPSGAYNVNSQTLLIILPLFVAFYYIV